MFKENLGRKRFVEKTFTKGAKSLSNIINLAQLAIQENDQEMASSFRFCFRKHKDLQLLVQAHSYLIKIANSKCKTKDYPTCLAIELLKEYEVHLLPYLCS
jgi:hypothetical protein